MEFEVSNRFQARQHEQTEKRGVAGTGVGYLLATASAAQPQRRAPVERPQNLGGFSGLRCAAL